MKQKLTMVKAKTDHPEMFRSLTINNKPALCIQVTDESGNTTFTLDKPMRVKAGEHVDVKFGVDNGSVPAVKNESWPRSSLTYMPVQIIN